MKKLTALRFSKIISLVSNTRYSLKVVLIFFAKKMYHENVAWCSMTIDNSIKNKKGFWEKLLVGPNNTFTKTLNHNDLFSPYLLKGLFTSSKVTRPLLEDNLTEWDRLLNSIRIMCGCGCSYGLMRVHLESVFQVQLFQVFQGLKITGSSTLSHYTIYLWI